MSDGDQQTENCVQEENLVHGGKDLMQTGGTSLTQKGKGCSVVLARDKKVFQEAVASVLCICERAVLRFFPCAKNSLEVMAKLLWFWCVTASVKFFS